jgi:hypothetical protein
MKRIWVKPDSEKGGFKIVNKSSENKERKVNFRKVRSWEILEDIKGENHEEIL